MYHNTLDMHAYLFVLFLKSRDHLEFHVGGPYICMSKLLVIARCKDCV